MNITLETTRFGRRAELDRMSREATVFLIKNPDVILGDRAVDESIGTLRLHTKTPMVDIFAQIINENKLRCFNTIDFKKLTGVPEVLTYNDITVDGKTVSGSIPEGLRKAWVNITPYKCDAYNSGFAITDIPAVASHYTRGFLSMSYNDCKDTWLTPALCVPIVEAFSSIVATMLRQFYNLEYEDNKLVQTLFAAYYASLLTVERTSDDIPTILFRCTFLGDTFSITERLRPMLDKKRELHLRWTIDDCCKLLASEVGPTRMNAIKGEQIYTMLSRSAADSKSMYIALDYPPYWVHQLLTNIQGSKNPMFNNMLKYVNMRNSLLKFADQLITSKLFIDKVNR